MHCDGTWHPYAGEKHHSTTLHVVTNLGVLGEVIAKLGGLGDVVGKLGGLGDGLGGLAMM